MTIKPESQAQFDFLSNPADVVIYGGAAGGGKTAALLIEPLRYIKNPEFRTVIFRRTTKQVKNPGGLWEKAGQFYGPCGAQAREVDLEYVFPSGMRVKFAHLENDKNKYDWQGSEIPLIMFDELTHFTESQFWYLFSRNRSLTGIRGKIRATCNPDANSFVYGLLRWYLDADGLPILARSNKIRYFLRINGEIIFAEHPQELADRYQVGIDEVKSFSFIFANIHDNQLLLKADPGYLSNLQAQPEEIKQQLLYGRWTSIRENRVLPELTADAEKRIFIDTPRPAYYKIYAGMDTGHNDFLAVVWGYYDFIRGKYVIEHEFVVREANTPTIAAGIAQIERDHYPNTDILRFTDIDPRLVADMATLHGIQFCTTRKDNKDAQINYLRYCIQQDKIEINPRCETTIEHCRFATWNSQRNDLARTEQHGHYDAMMAVVYILRNINIKENPYPLIDPAKTGLDFAIPERKEYNTSGELASSLAAHFDEIGG